MQTHSRPGLILGLLAFANILSYYDRMLMVVLGEPIKQQFVLSDKQLSLLTGGTFVLMYGIVGLAGGRLIDRVNRKRVLVAALSLWSLMTAACGLAPSFAILAVARAGVGIGESSSLPIATALIADIYPPKRRAAANAIVLAGSSVGVLLAFVVGSWIAAKYGWRAAFFAGAPPGLLLALAVSILVREPARESETKHLGNIPSGLGPFGLIWNNKALVWLILAGSFTAFATIGLMQWLPMFFVRTHHLSISQVGLWFGPALAGGMTAGILLGGVIGARVSETSIPALLNICSISQLLLVPLFWTMLGSSSAGVAIGLTFAGAAIAVINTPMFTSAWQTLCDPRARGTMAGLVGLCSMIIGGGLCTFVTGAMSDALLPYAGADSLRYALALSMIFCLIAAGLFAKAGALVRASVLS